MSKISIAIIIICTAVVAAVVFFSLKEEPGMEDIYLLSSENIENELLKDTGIRDFSNHDSSIYAVIPVTGAKTGEQLHVEWIFLGQDGNEIIQKDSIEIENDGNGSIAVYLLKADSAYKPGNYQVRVDYNGIMKKQVNFAVTGDQSLDVWEYSLPSLANSSFTVWNTNSSAAFTVLSRL